MSKEKRLIFTVTPGRSGTFYLTHLLQGLPDIHAEDEAEPGFHDWLPEARHDPVLAEKLLIEKKLPFIQAISQKTYIETSHYFSKGFVDPLVRLGINFDLILLKREPRKVAGSRFLIGGGMKELRAGKYYPDILGPHEPNFLPARNITAWNDYQLCYWYSLETFFRMKHYAQLIASRGGKIFETALESLASGDNYGKLLAWLNVPEDIIRTRVDNIQAREEKVNLLLPVKKQFGRESILASLDLEALEAKVLQDCGLSADFPQTVMQTPVFTPSRLPSIFVNIAAYRDPQCQYTVKDLFAKAAHPERVNVGICWQYEPQQDQACFAIDSPRPKQTRIVQHHIRDSKGANWARAQAFGLARDEEYILVIDSHMRFEPGWDELLLDALKRCPGEKSLLTAWLPGYKPPDFWKSITAK